MRCKVESWNLKCNLINSINTQNLSLFKSSKVSQPWFHYTPTPSPAFRKQRKRRCQKKVVSNALNLDLMSSLNPSLCIKVGTEKNWFRFGFCRRWCAYGLIFYGRRFGVCKLIDFLFNTGTNKLVRRKSFFYCITLDIYRDWVCYAKLFVGGKKIELTNSLSQSLKYSRLNISCVKHLKFTRFAWKRIFIWTVNSEEKIWSKKVAEIAKNIFVRTRTTNYF